MGSYVDETGLSRLASNLKSYVDAKASEGVLTEVGGFGEESDENLARYFATGATAPANWKVGDQRVAQVVVPYTNQVLVHNIVLTIVDDAPYEVVSGKPARFIVSVNSYKSQFHPSYVDGDADRAARQWSYLLAGEQISASDLKSIWPSSTFGTFGNFSHLDGTGGWNDISNIDDMLEQLTSSSLAIGLPVFPTWLMLAIKEVNVVRDQGLKSAEPSALPGRMFIPAAIELFGDEMSKFKVNSNYSIQTSADSALHRFKIFDGVKAEDMFNLIDDDSFSGSEYICTTTTLSFAGKTRFSVFEKGYDDDGMFLMVSTYTDRALRNLYCCI